MPAAGRFPECGSSPALTLLVGALAVAWALFVGSLAQARHDNLRTNAFDLGYISQTLWNTAHGEPFRLTVLEGATFRPEGLDPSRVRQPHSYLAFHVEPIDLPLAALYALRPDPSTLLWLQAVGLALGALPAAWLGRRVLRSSTGGAVVGVSWLLTPGLEGAALSDFHAVALGASLLMTGLWAWETERPGWATALLLLAAATREDAALAVASLGVVLALRALSLRERVRVGAPLAIAGLAGSWTFASFFLIAPYFNGGGSLFVSRYAWLWRNPGDAPLSDIVAYLATQLLTGGVLCLLAPFQLLAAAPLLAMNALSSFDWMRSGGAHYSALLGPFLLWAGAHGARRLLPWLPAELRGLPPGLLLGGALAAQLWIGTTTVPAPDPRAASVLAGLSVVPASVPASASSALYPHLANRSRLYWFPAVQDAEWIAIDVASTSHPLTALEMRDAAAELLASGVFSLEAARDGLLVLRRGRPGELPGGSFVAAVRAPASDPEAGRPADLPRRVAAVLPAEFFDFVRGAAGPSRGRFGPSLELVGARLHRWPQVGLSGDAGVLETSWRATAPIPDDLHFALAATRRSDGALVGLSVDLAAAPIWYPTSRWAPGEVVRMDMPIDRLGGLGALGVAVLDGGGARLPASAPITWEDGTIVPVTSTPLSR